jgi:plastocyanin
MGRLSLRLAAVVLLSLALAGPTVAAQDATPAETGSLLTSLGYPELQVRVTDDAIEAPSQAAAGLTLLTVDNASSEDTGVFLLAPPPGTSMADLRAAIEASPTPEEEFPSWFYDAVLTGGPSVFAGGRGQAVINLTPGDWAVVSEGNQEPSPITVTEGASPTAMTEPSADLTVELKEYAFSIPEEVSSGPQIWELTNIGEQPHVMFMVKSPGPVTLDQVMALLQAPENATPSPGVPNPEEFEDIGGLTIISAGRTAWMEFDLQPGYYIALCFIPDRETHEPHALLGMVSIFTVGEVAGGVASPATSGESATSTSTVEIKDFAFNPGTIEVPAGTTVTWTNQDFAPHTATADDGSFDTGRLDQGQTGSVTFDQPGTYTYTCTFHPNMKGTVVVT